MVLGARRVTPGSRDARAAAAESGAPAMFSGNSRSGPPSSKLQAMCPHSKPVRRYRHRARVVKQPAEATTHFDKLGHPDVSPMAATITIPMPGRAPGRHSTHTMSECQTGVKRPGVAHARGPGGRYVVRARMGSTDGAVISV